MGKYPTFNMDDKPINLLSISNDEKILASGKIIFFYITIFIFYFKFIKKLLVKNYVYGILINLFKLNFYKS